MCVLFFPLLLFCQIFCMISVFGTTTDEKPVADFSPIKFRNCKSRFELISVETTACLESDRCQFARDKEYTIRIGFRPNRRVDSLKPSVWAHLGDANGALTRFHIENEDACTSSNITCPLEPGKDYWYSQSVRILPEYPTVDLQVNWLLVSPDAERNELGLPLSREVCIKFLAKVTEE